MVTSSQRRKPIVVRTAQTAPEPDPAPEDQNDPETTAADDLATANDEHTAGGEGRPMDGSLETPIPTVTTYPTYPEPSAPPNAFVIDEDNKASADWFEEDPNNDMIVYAKEDIVEKVYPPNTVTPSYIQRVGKGAGMTKAAVNVLLGG